MAGRDGGRGGGLEKIPSIYFLEIRMQIHSKDTLTNPMQPLPYQAELASLKGAVHTSSCCPIQYEWNIKNCPINYIILYSCDVTWTSTIWSYSQVPGEWPILIKAKKWGGDVIGFLLQVRSLWPRGNGQLQGC